MTLYAMLRAAETPSDSPPSKYGAPGDATPTPRLRGRVVVADDDRDTVLSLTALLEDEGFDTLGVHHGNEVVRAVVEFRADAALVDIGMPGMSGYDIARALRRRFDGAKPLLIAVTAWTKHSDRLMARAAGFDHHVAKPYDPSRLLELLAQIATPGA